MTESRDTHTASTDGQAGIDDGAFRFDETSCEPDQTPDYTSGEPIKMVGIPGRYAPEDYRRLGSVQDFGREDTYDFD